MEPTDVVREIETNLEGFLLAFCRTPASEVIRSPGYTQVLTSLPIGMFNLVLGTALPADQARARVQEINERYTARGVPACWWTTPSTRPENLEELLRPSGWFLSHRWRGMVRELDGSFAAAAPADLEILRADSAAQRAEWLAVFRGGFGASERLTHVLAEAWRGSPLPFTLYLGRRKDESLGTALVFRTGSVAGVYCVCTLPGARRTGIGTGLMQGVLAEAEQQGRRRAIVQATEMGERLYRRLGFREECWVRMLGRRDF